MAKAFVLINCDLGSEDNIINEIGKLEHVEEVIGTFGAYDIVAKVEGETTEQVRETITWKIRKMNKVRSTLTLMEVEGQGEL
jgi:DNA-binding Lrp family transcriptional regulator|tara:strand:- start:312 stop:557 length:246 start_codon:yes stop_codon:yes gene_type:complete